MATLSLDDGWTMVTPSTEMTRNDMVEDYLSTIAQGHPNPAMPCCHLNVHDDMTDCDNEGFADCLEEYFVSEPHFQETEHALFSWCIINEKAPCFPTVGKCADLVRDWNRHVIKLCVQRLMPNCEDVQQLQILAKSLMMNPMLQSCMSKGRQFMNKSVHISFRR